MLKFIKIKRIQKKKNLVKKENLKTIFVLNSFINTNKKSILYIFNNLYGISIGSLNIILIKFGIKNIFFSNTVIFYKKIFFLVNFFDEYFKNKVNVKNIENKFLLNFQKYLNFIGFRHIHGLPVNGQRTCTNAKSCRSLIFHKRLLKIIKENEKNE